MSAALALAVDAQADHPDPVVAVAEPPPRKLTVGRLEKALRTDPRFEPAFGLAKLVPLGARPVLTGLLRAIVRSEELGVFRISPLLATVPPGSVLAHAMGMHEWAVEVQAGLEALLAAGVVIHADGVLTLPLDFEALTRPKDERQDPEAGWLPRGHTAETFAALTPAARASALSGRHGGRPKGSGKTRPGDPIRAPGQRELLSPMGVVVGGASPKPAGQVFDNLGGSGFAQVSGQVSANDENLGSLGFSRGEESTAAAASEFESRFSAAAAAIPSSAGVRGEKPGGQVSGNLAVVEGGKPGSAGPGPEAMLLGGEFAAQFRWDLVHVHEAPVIVQRFLDRGYTGSMLRAVRTAKAGVTCSGMGYFEKPLHKLFPEVLAPPPSTAGAGAGPGSAPRYEIREDVATDPEWGDLRPGLQHGISRVLEAFEMPDGQERDRRLSAAKAIRAEECRLVGRRHPALLEALGWATPESDAAEG